MKTTLLLLITVVTVSTKGHNFSLIPEIGYFLSSHFMTGIKFGYHTSKNEA